MAGDSTKLVRTGRKVRTFKLARPEVIFVGFYTNIYIYIFKHIYICMYMLCYVMYMLCHMLCYVTYT